MERKYIYSLSKRFLKPNVGSKAKNIHFLLRHGIKVPDSWVILWTAYEEYLLNNHMVEMDLRRELSTIIDPRKSYAVRSSASVEDSGEFSCAGLFKSYLQVQGIDDIISSISKVWLSLESPEFESYWKNIIHLDTKAQMAVIIQEMVQPLFSGVVFTKNPVTGLSETIIEAGPGTGESQVNCHQDLERWVSKWGNWSQKPKDGKMMESLAREIVYKAKDISLSYGKPVDLEWAWDGHSLYFLQVRPITRLDIPVYSNRIAREMLPGIIKPLVWSVNTRLINPVWANILKRLTGEDSWDPDKFTGHYYYRAYFNMSIFGRVFERLGMPAEALELLFGLEQDGPEKPKMRPGIGLIPRLPGLLMFAMSLIGINHRLNRLVKLKNNSYGKIASKMEEELEPLELLELASKIFEETKSVAYYNIRIPLQAMMYHRLLFFLLKKYGYDLRTIELKGAKEAAEQYNPQYKLQILHERYFGDSEINPEEVALSPEKEEELRKDIDKFLKTFGHLSDSGNDCSSIPWRETPDLIRRMIVQQKPINSEQKTQSFEELNLPWIQKILIGMVFNRTSRFAVNREEISSLYTYGYGQFRTCFARLGEKLVNRGVLDDREDIYYLYWSELLEVVGTKDQISIRALVSKRRQEMESYRKADLPEMILGHEQPPLTTSIPVELEGIPTSLGTYTGPARVVHGIKDFDKIQDGDVLVIPFADVGWTPLFAKAGAVVSESGGMLSHTSIVAREYRIPAVVSVTGACRLDDNTQITVNGYTGEILRFDEGRKG